MSITMDDGPYRPPGGSPAGLDPSVLEGGAGLVLIVEENPLCARLFRAMLHPLGCVVLLARTLDEGADLLRAAGGGARAPLLLMPRGRNPRRDAEEAEAVAAATGAAAVLFSKPVTQDGLAALVRRHLAGLH